MKKSIIKKLATITMAVTMSMTGVSAVFATVSANGQELEIMMEHYGNDYIDEHLDAKFKQLVILLTMTSLQAYSQINWEARL